VASPPFVHLNVHSAYSLHQGASRCEELAARAAAQGHVAIALTDGDAVYGAHVFQQCCDAVGVRPLLGAEVSDGDARAVLLAQDAAGWRSLCRIVTRRRLAEGFSLASDVPRDAAGLVVLTPSPPLLAALADDLPRGALYGEAVAWAPAAEREAVVRAARAVSRPVAGTHRVFFDRPQRRRLHRVLLAIGHLKLLGDVTPGALGRDGRPLDLAPEAASLLPPEAAAAAFDDVPGAAAATVEVAERCRFRLEKPARPRLPVIALGEGETAYGRLAGLCMAGLAERYRPLRPDVVERLERELRVIHDRGFADYFLVVHGLASFARRRGIPAVGRGSAASSLVAYALRITSVDPLRHDLPFERFLSPVRADCPDIDLDLDWRGRDEVIRSAYETYGDDRVAMISTHVTFQARAAVREVGKVLGLPPPEVSRLVEHLPWRLSAALDPARRPPELRGLPLEREPWRGLLRAAATLDGFPRHLSIHTGGIVVGDGPLSDALPLERSAKGLVVTQFEMRAVEATGFVKIDLLGNRALAVVADVVRHARACEGEEIDLDGVPEDDARAADLLRTGGTLGCFQVESPGMRNLVVRMEARTQEDAMIALSLIRPGPAGSGMKDAYVRRRRGEEATPAVHPLFDRLVARTHGVMLYQEDALRAAAAVGGFDLAAADALRRAFSKKRAPDDLPRMEAAFHDGARARGVPRDVAEAVWALVRNFSAYAYVKAHAATYARISWQALWLKSRRPAEYLAAVLRNEAGFYPPRAYVEEARRLGCRVEVPCVNRSEVGATGCRGVLRLGLAQVKGLRVGTPEEVVRVREAKGPYLSFGDLLLRTTLERAETERLVLAGALDVFDRPRPELLWHVTLDYDRYAKVRAEEAGARAARAAGEGAAFGGGSGRLFGREAFLAPHRFIPVPPDYPPARLLELEMETLGLTATAHPMALVRDAAARHGAVATTALSRHVGRRVSVAGFVLTDRRVRTSKGRYMKFVMLEDLSGTVEAVLFPEAYHRLGPRLAGPGPFLATGLVRRDHGALTLDVKDVALLAPDEELPGRNV
jgi:DNA-directed DNA polymerase III PolC